VLVVGGRVVACAERVPAHVVGDGTRSVRELVAEANRDPRRGRGHAKVLTYLPCDAVTEEYLARRGLTLDGVPAAGERVFLRATANLSTGGTSVDRTDEMHPDNVTACEMAAGVVGLDVAGIDVLTPDISVPFRENGAVIIEVNAGPGSACTRTPRGARAQRGRPIVDLLYGPGQPTTIPVIAVTGTNGRPRPRASSRTCSATRRERGLHHHRRHLPRQPPRSSRGHDRARGRPTSSCPTPPSTWPCSRRRAAACCARASATTSATWAWCST
jgi:hypothetical protein